MATLPPEDRDAFNAVTLFDLSLRGGGRALSASPSGP